MTYRGYRSFASVAGALLFASALSSPASAVVLTNGSGDGQVSVDVTNAGAFGSSSGGGNAFYNPVGPMTAAGTTYESYVYFRVGTSGARSNLSGLSATLTDSSATSATSTFATSGLSFTLVQSLSDLVSGMTQTGTLLEQQYSFTNTTGSALTFEFTRYLDGDLLFDGSLVDGGGRLMSGGREILFETDSATGSADSATFVGIYNEGGISLGYEIDSYSGLRSRIEAGTALDNIVTGDGADADQFIDAGNGYDVSLGLGRRFTLAAGASGVFTTATIFGSGAPEDVPLPAVPEPASWGMMILGFGMIGAAARRRRRAVAFAA